MIMNDSTDKKTNGSGESQGCGNCDYTLAFLLLRGWLAVRAIMAGLEKYGAYKTIQQPLLDANGQLTPVPAVDVYGLLVEPWIFVIDRDGVVTASFEAVVSEKELLAAVDAVK